MVGKVVFAEFFTRVRDRAREGLSMQQDWDLWLGTPGAHDPVIVLLNP